MATTMSRKDQETIRRAWAATEYIADMDHSMKRKLGDALRYEVRQGRDTHNAKALILSEVFSLHIDGTNRKQARTVADLADISDGCAMGCVIGAYWRARDRTAHTAKEYPRALELARLAMVAHNADILRRLDAVGVGAH